MQQKPPGQSGWEEGAVKLVQFPTFHLLPKRDFHVCQISSLYVALTFRIKDQRHLHLQIPFSLLLIISWKERREEANQCFFLISLTGWKSIPTKICVQMLFYMSKNTINLSSFIILGWSLSQASDLLMFTISDISKKHQIQTNRRKTALILPHCQWGLISFK